MKSFLNTLWILLSLIALLLTSCGVDQKKEDPSPNTEPDSPPILLEEAPTVLRRGDLRLLCLSEDDLVLEELVSRFNQSHTEQITLITPPNEPSIDTDAYYHMAFSGDYDVIVSGSYPLLRMLAAADVLSPMDLPETGDALPSILDAGRVDDSLYMLAPFHQVRGIRTAAPLPAEYTQSIRGIGEYVATLSPEDRLGLGREATYLLSGDHGIPVAENSLPLFFPMNTPTLDALLDLDFLLSESSSDGPATGPISLYADPVSDLSAGNWTPEADYLPFPLEEGTGFTIDSPQIFAISKKTQVWGSAMDFLSMLLSKEIQQMELTATPGSLYQVHLSLPISRSALAEVLTKRAENAMGNDWNHLDEWISDCTTSSEGADHFSAHSLLLELNPALHQARTLPRDGRSAFLEETLASEIKIWHQRVNYTP